MRKIGYLLCLIIIVSCVTPSFQKDKLAKKIIFKERIPTNLAIDRCFRNRGIARELLEKILFFGRLNKVTICTLEVRVSNYKAINLYKKLGFMLYGLNKNYYRDNNEDALIMWKELNHGQER